MRKKRKKKPGDPAQPQPELNQASRAQLGPDEEKRPYRPRDDDASTEDPLHDWPEEDR
jgi:hypothetical protein